ASPHPDCPTAGPPPHAAPVPPGAPRPTACPSTPFRQRRSSVRSDAAENRPYGRGRRVGASTSISGLMPDPFVQWLRPAPAPDWNGYGPKYREETGLLTPRLPHLREPAHERPAHREPTGQPYPTGTTHSPSLPEPNPAHSRLTCRAYDRQSPHHPPQTEPLPPQTER